MAKVPEKIGKYKIIDLLAQGGMGALYRGVHPTLEKEVILKKLILRGNPDFAERFRREARILMEFRHDNIVDVYDHFKEGRSHYIVLEYIDGMSLEDLIRRERYLPNEFALYIFFISCKALMYAHKKNVIHRDIKPSNVLLSKHGEVKLLDFGIATTEEDADQGLTREGMTLGSPAYMAPEQFENSRSVDKRADIYSMGVMLYEMVTGKRPYSGGFSADLIAAVQKGRYPSPRRYNPEISPLIRRIIKKSLNPKPHRRFQDLQELIKLLESSFDDRRQERMRRQVQKAVQGQAAEAAPPPRGAALHRFVASFAIGVLLLGTLGVLGWASGLHYELLWPDQYGALVLEVPVEDGLPGEPHEPHIEAQLYVDEGDRVEAASSTSLRFQRVTEESGGEKYRSQKVYLPAREYRAKLVMDGRLYWKSFALQAREEQRRSLNSRESLVLEFPASSAPPVPVEVSFYIQDRETWARIDGIARIEVWRDDGWVEWSEEVAEGLRSGVSRRFRFSAPGYESKVFDIDIRPQQTFLHINPHLTRK